MLRRSRGCRDRGRGRGRRRAPVRVCRVVLVSVVVALHRGRGALVASSSLVPMRSRGPSGSPEWALVGPLVDAQFAAEFLDCRRAQTLQRGTTGLRSANSSAVRIQQEKYCTRHSGATRTRSLWRTWDGMGPARRFASNACHAWHICFWVSACTSVRARNMIAVWQNGDSSARDRRNRVLRG